MKFCPFKYIRNCFSKTSCNLNNEQDMITEKKCCVKPFIFNAILIFSISTLSLFTLGNFAFKKFIEKNPKLIISSVENMYKKEQEEMQKNAQSNSAKIFQQIIKEDDRPYLGNKNGTKIVTVFYDYACGHCKSQDAELLNLAKEDKDVKIMLIDWPIFSGASYIAALAGCTVFDINYDQFLVYHKNLISATKVDKDSIENALKSAKILNPKNFLENQVIKNEKCKKMIESNNSLARELNLQGTPASIIANTSNPKNIAPFFSPGLITSSKIKTIINK